MTQLFEKTTCAHEQRFAEMSTERTQEVERFVGILKKALLREKNNSSMDAVEDAVLW